MPSLIFSLYRPEARPSRHTTGKLIASVFMAKLLAHSHRWTWWCTDFSQGRLDYEDFFACPIVVRAVTYR